MENNETGFALGMLGGTHNEEEHEEAMREYERRKANADKIEAAVMAACTEISGRMEANLKDMSNKEIAEAASCLVGLATLMGALSIYAAKPYTGGLGCT